jgi:uncharacterized protein YbjT (DUF2867 family)
VRDERRARELLGPGTELVLGSMEDSPALQRLYDNAELAFVVSSQPPLEIAAIDAAASSGVPRIVKSSALARLTEPPQMHRAAEDRLIHSGVAWTILRPSAFMQTVGDYLPTLIDADGAFYLPAGDGRTGFVDVRDIATCALAR